MDVQVVSPGSVDEVTTPNLVLDGLVGYSLSGRPHGAVADLIEWANAEPTDILALDVPLRP